MLDFETVAQVGDIPDGEGRAFEYNDQMVAVFNNGGQYLAIDDMCPHMGASLASGHFEDCVVTCPWHAWSFDARDGSWCENRRIKIDTYEVRVQGTDIQVRPAEKSPEVENDPKSNPTNSGEVTGPDQVDPGLVHPADDPERG